MSLQIRDATPADLSDILRIADSCPELPKWSVATYRSLLQGDTAARRSTAQVGVAHDTLVAFGAMFTLPLLRPVESEIETLAVLASQRRHGYGAAMLQVMLARAAVFGEGVVHLEVRSANVAALALYQRAGFVVTGRRKAYYTNPIDDALLLSLRC